MLTLKTACTCMFCKWQTSVCIWYDRFCTIGVLVVCYYATSTKKINGNWWELATIMAEIYKMVQYFAIFGVNLFSVQQPIANWNARIMSGICKEHVRYARIMQGSCKDYVSHSILGTCFIYMCKEYVWNMQGLCKDVKVQVRNMQGFQNLFKSM